MRPVVIPCCVEPIRPAVSSYNVVVRMLEAKAGELEILNFGGRRMASELGFGRLLHLIGVNPKRVRGCAETIALRARFALIEKFFTRTGPVFIVGCGNSGTTLLRSQLAEHELLHVIDRETRAFRSRTERSRRCSRDRIRLRKLVAWRRTSLDRGKVTFVEKTPGHVHHYREIRDAAPHAKFIIIFRDPVDTVASLTKRKLSFEWAIHRWIDDNNSALSIPQQKSTLFVNFVDLIKSNEETMARVVRFIGVPSSERVFRPVVTTPPEIPDYSQHSLRRSQQTAGPIYDSTGVGASSLSADQIDMVTASCSATYRELEKRAEADKACKA